MAMDETIRKCARTYSQALRLMERYPEYRFFQSSALHLDWMRQYYPAIFEGIRQRVLEGRYEPNGGVWVECDCNIPSGESHRAAVFVWTAVHARTFWLHQRLFLAAGYLWVQCGPAADFARMRCEIFLHHQNRLERSQQIPGGFLCVAGYGW